MIHISTDGGSRGNPGPSAIGVVIKSDVKLLFELGKQIGEATNNVAEYRAIIAAYEWLIAHSDILIGEDAVHFSLDSQLIYSQIIGVYKVKDSKMQSLWFQACEQEKILKQKTNMKISYGHIPREQNKEADRLVNMALDNLL